MRRVELPSRVIQHFESRGFTHRRVLVMPTLHVSLAELDGVIGGHDAPSRQLLVVVAGRVACRTREGEEVELGVGEAVAWEAGEWHETRSLERARLLLIEGEWT